MFMTRLVMAVDMQELGLLNHVIAAAVTCLIFLHLHWSGGQICFTKPSPMTNSDVSLLASELE